MWELPVRLRMLRASEGTPATPLPRGQAAVTPEGDGAGAGGGAARCGVGGGTCPSSVCGRGCSRLAGAEALHLGWGCLPSLQFCVFPSPGPRTVSPEDGIPEASRADARAESVF